MTFTPSMTTTFDVLGEPLMVMVSIDVQVVKLRFMLVSCTPGTTASRPQTSRPFIWNIRQLLGGDRSHARTRRRLHGGRLRGDRHRIRELSHLQRQALETAHFGRGQRHVGHLERREPAERHLDRVTAGR